MKKRITAFVCALCLFISVILPASAAELTSEQRMERIGQIISLIESRALEYEGEDVLLYGLDRLFELYPDSYDAFLDAMLTGYDSHSMYVPGSYETAFPSAADSYVGIGISMRNEDNGSVTISSISPHGPAYGSGLMVGDRIIAVNGVNMLGAPASNMAILLKGDEGTTASITVARGPVLLTYNVTRGAVTTPNLEGKVMGDGLYYLKISRFTDAYTYMLYSNALKEMTEASTKALIIDLRGNPGGDVSMVLTFLRQLIPDDGRKYFTIAARDTELGPDVEESYSTGAGPRLNKIVILTDGESASASEIMTSSLRDLGYAVTVGETTFGKARGQSHMVFEDGAAAVVTTVALVPPSGVDYEGVGLKPDYPVENYTAKHPAASCMPVPVRRYSLGDMGYDVTLLLKALKAMELVPQDYETTVFDGKLLDGVNSLRRAMGKEEAGSLNTETVEDINLILEALSTRQVEVDAQLEKAVQVASRYTSGPLKYMIYQGRWQNLTDK